MGQIKQDMIRRADSATDRDREVATLREENKRLRKALNSAAATLNGLYGDVTNEVFSDTIAPVLEEIESIFAG